MKKLMATVMIMALALVLVACSSSSTGGSADASSGSASADAEPQEQVFESELAVVKYRNKAEPTAGNAMYSFSFENKTDATVMVGSQDLVVNGKYSVEALGGSAAPIQPGKTGSVSLTFGYTVQTDLGSIDDITKLSGELLVIDDGTFDTIGTVPFDVEV